MTLADNQTSEGALEKQANDEGLGFGHSPNMWIIDHKRTRIAAG